MDIVIPYRIPPHGTHELQFALRSACEHYDVGRVFLLGDKPEWCTGVVHVPGGDGTQNPIWNVMRKLSQFLASGQAPTQFTVWNDDMYILQPGVTLGHTADSGKTVGDLSEKLIGRYRQAAQRAVDFFGPGWHSYELHKPLSVDAASLSRVLASERSPCLWRTSLALEDGLTHGVDYSGNPEPDRLAITADDVAELMQGPWFASRDTMATAAEFVLPMRKRFPDKCRFEV